MAYLNYIETIGKRCREAAKRRGKDTTCLGCVRYLETELAEYWRAVDNDNLTPLDAVSELFSLRVRLSDGAFVKIYDEKIHNTTLDELADLYITAATYLQEFKSVYGDDFRPMRSTDELLIQGTVDFAHSQVESRDEIDGLRIVLSMKMEYNELRKD